MKLAQELGNIYKRVRRRRFNEMGGVRVKGYISEETAHDVQMKMRACVAFFRCMPIYKNKGLFLIIIQIYLFRFIWGRSQTKIIIN